MQRFGMARGECECVCGGTNKKSTGDRQTIDQGGVGKVVWGGEEENVPR